MNGFYLTVTSSALYTLDAPIIDILIDGIAYTSFTESEITGTGTTTHHFFIELTGTTPSSISAQINDSSSEVGREVLFEEFLLNGRDIRQASQIDSENQAPSFNFTDNLDFNLTDTEYIFGQAEPVVATFGTPTFVSTTGADFHNGSRLEDDIVDLGDGNDVVNGNQGDDILFGGAGNDRLIGSFGADVLVGGDGIDELRGQVGDDIIYGGADRDFIYGNEGNDTLNGGAGSDRINGFDDNDLIYGGTGDDILNGDAGDDRIFGEDGKDFINGGIGNDYIDAGIGDDVIDAGEGDDTVMGGEGNDRIFTYDGADIIDGGAGLDFIRAGDGDDMVSGGDGNDNIFGEDGNDTINGDGGQDVISGGLGDDTINGGGGADRLFGDEGNDTINGGDFNDTIFGGAGNDIINGDAGSDRILGGDDADIINGGRGFDFLLGESGNDTINGGNGDDLIGGGNGDDILEGGNGNDTLDGGDGNDTLNGGAGNDTIYGATVIGESGIESVVQTNGSTWHTVTFSTAILNPIVKLSNLTNNDGDPYSIRVQNLTSSGFQFQLDEFDYLDGSRILAEDVSWLAISEGTHTLDNGAVIQAGRAIVTNETTTTVTFDSAFSNAPVVLSQVISDNDDAAVVTRNRNATANGFQVNLLEEEAADGIHATEEIGYIAIEAIGSPASGFLVGQTTATINENVTTINFGGTFANTPVFVHDQQTVNGGDTSYSQADGITTTTANILIGEEQSRDVEIRHPGRESVGYFALNEGLLTAANGGDNVFNGGAGVDTLFGSDGADTFIFEAAHAFTDNDILADFSAGEGDVLDISDIISGISSPITDYIFLDDTSGTDTIVRVDADGLANGSNFQAIATINGITGLDEVTLFTDGNIII